LADRLRSRNVLDALGNSLEQRANDSSQTNFARQDAQLSLNALNSFLRMERNLLSGFVFHPAPSRQLPRMIGGVSVSTFLDLLVRREKGNNPECGGVLFRLTKADEDETDAAAGKRKEIASYAATLVQMQVRATLLRDAVAHHDLCMSVDVQSGDVQAASRNFATKAQRLEAECRFIAAMWDAA
jgi:hypothetical protein